MTDVNHRDTEDTENAQRLSLGWQCLDGGVVPKISPLCVSVFSVSLWLTSVIERSCRYD